MEWISQVFQGFKSTDMLEISQVLALQKLYFKNTRSLQPWHSAYLSIYIFNNKYSLVVKQFKTNIAVEALN